MPTNSDRIATLLRMSEREAVQFCNDVRKKFAYYVHTSAIHEAIVQLIRQDPGAKPGLKDLVHLFRQRDEVELEVEKRAEEKRRKAATEGRARVRTVAGERWRLDTERYQKIRAAEAARQAQVIAAQQTARIAAVRQKQANLGIRAQEIQRICQQSGVTVLAHFTRVTNLSSILRRGLLGRNILAPHMGWLPIFNDPVRLDGCREAVCLSISFPNYQMFYRLSVNNRADWVVLLLDASVLWEQDCAFCRENAASKAVREIPLDARRQQSALADMFTDYPPVVRASLAIPANYTTHPQAEVLALDPIPCNHIRAAHFLSQEAFHNWRKGDKQAYHYQFFVGSQYFARRTDFAVWSATAA